MQPNMLAWLMMQSQVANTTCGDIQQDLWILYEYATRVRDVVEFGVRDGVSTSAFLAAQPLRLRSYDIAPCPHRETLILARGRTHWSFHQADVLKIPPLESCDLLFIDTYHTYTQLCAELDRHAKNVSRFILLHDTLSFGTRGEDGSEPGLIAAYSAFIQANPQWRVHLVSMAQNGLTVLARRGE